MPNHMSNNLVILGEPSQIRQIADLLIDREIEEVTFDRLIPMPQDLKDGDGDALGWAREHWGTKWDAYDTDHLVEDPAHDRLELRFTTAWTAPEPVFAEIAERFGVRVYAMWQEPGGEVSDATYGTDDEASEVFRVRQEVEFA